MGTVETKINWYIIDDCDNRTLSDIVAKHGGNLIIKYLRMFDDNKIKLFNGMDCVTNIILYSYGCTPIDLHLLQNLQSVTWINRNFDGEYIFSPFVNHGGQSVTKQTNLMSRQITNVLVKHSEKTTVKLITEEEFDNIILSL